MSFLNWKGRALWTLLVAAALVRVFVFSITEFHPDAGDAVNYHQCAMNVLHHGTYSESSTAPFTPTVYRAPLYSFFLAVVYGLFGSDFWIVQAVQVALSVGFISMLSAAIARIHPATGRTLWPLWLLLPFDVLYSGALLSETLTTFLIVLLVYLFVALDDSILRAVCLGFAAALLALCRDIYLPLLVILPLGYLIAKRPLTRQSVVRAIVYWVCFASLVGCWTLRNYTQTGQFVVISKGRLGFSLWMGTWATNGEFTKNDKFGRTYPGEAYWSDAERSELQTKQDPALLDPVYMRYAKEHFVQEPAAVLKRWLVRAPLLWGGTRTDLFDFRADWFPRGSLQWKVLKVWFLALNTMVLLLGVVGMVLAARSRHPLAWLAIPLVYTSALFFPLNSFENRYSQPVFGLLVAFAAYACTRAFARSAAQRDADQPGSAPGAVTSSGGGATQDRR
jgi:hypothetical protein